MQRSSELCDHASFISSRRSGLWLASLGLAVVIGLVVLAARAGLPVAQADPIPPPEGYPKLSLSTKTVTPTLAHTGGEVLTFVIAIQNTGAYTAAETVLTDPMPDDVVYNGDASSSASPPPMYADGVLSWQGDVGFDSTVVVTFSVTVAPTLTGTVRNTAVISQALIAEPVTVTAEAIVTDDPILTLAKESMPAAPGPNKILTYALRVGNIGQPAVDMPLTVVDHVPLDTTFYAVDPYGITDGEVITWTRDVDLDTGETTVFTFSVEVSDVPSGTVIVNEEYEASSPEAGVTAGEPYSVTVIDPILMLSKSVWPDPPGSNREVTFTLTLLNVGSLATGLIITDRVPANVAYVRGGTELDGVVSWGLDELDTGESAQFNFTVYISDIAEVPVINDDYGACCSEGVCVAGLPLTSPIQGPVFETEAYVDPIAHKPGGGSGTEVTPTLVIRNVGHGYALDATAHLLFGRIQVGFGDLYSVPAVGTLYDTGPECPEKWNCYTWIGNMAPGDVVTFTTYEGQNTIGGDEGTPYTATVIITDSLANTTTTPVSDTAIGLVTHFANLVPLKTGPPVIGVGQLLTYSIQVYNRAHITDLPPVLTDVVPLSTTFVWASDGGALIPDDEGDFVSWTLPLLSPGEGVVREFSVQVDEGLVSGTQIINDRYSVFGYGNVMTDAVTSGPPVTTTVQEVGLIDSFKEVTPALSLPGPGVLLTFTLHVVNSGPHYLSAVTLHDTLPWQHSTFQRDATATGGVLTSDIVSLGWTGDLAPFSEELITFTVVVDPYYEGAITNTATISHPDLRAEVVVQAVAYITDEPVLRITKTDWPDPVLLGSELTYRVQVANLGQQATGLVITDVIPLDTEYVADSATGGGQLVGDRVRWDLLLLEPGKHQTLSFRVKVLGGERIVNDRYAVRSAEGIADAGPPVITLVKRIGIWNYLPLIFKSG